jgi:hypothetical protein
MDIAKFLEIRVRQRISIPGSDLESPFRPCLDRVGEAMMEVTPLLSGGRSVDLESFGWFTVIAQT